MDLSPFKQINPCGYKGPVTQIKDLNKDISKLQLHEIIIDLLRKYFSYGNNCNYKITNRDGIKAVKMVKSSISTLIFLHQRNQAG